MITSEQSTVLKNLIWHSKDGNSLAKKLLVFLINNSEGLTKEVCVSLQDGEKGYAVDEINIVMNGIGSFLASQNMEPSILFRLAGSDFRVTYHYGHYEPDKKGGKLNKDGQFPGIPMSALFKPNPGLAREGMPLCYTFWLSAEDYSDSAKLLFITRDELEQIKPF